MHLRKKRNCERSSAGELCARQMPSTKRKRKPQPPDDWRDRLFFWRGAIQDKKWTGTMECACDDSPESSEFREVGVGLPSDEDFAASGEFRETFEFECTKNIASLVVSDATGLPSDASFKGTEHHWCGGGDLLPTATSMEISVVEGPSVGNPFGDSAWANVAARGTSESGDGDGPKDFVALGLLERIPGLGAGKGWTRLTLGGRFLADDDPRRSMTPAEVLGRIDANEEGPEMWACEQPWLALPYKVPPTWPASLPINSKVLAAAKEGSDDDGFTD